MKNGFNCSTAFRCHLQSYYEKMVIFSWLGNRYHFWLYDPVLSFQFYALLGREVHHFCYFQYSGSECSHIYSDQTQHAENH